MNRRDNCYVVICIAIVNVLVYLILEIIGNTSDVEFMLNHGAMYVPYVFERQKWYMLFTSMFLHFGIDHLINNMIMIVGVGNYIEKFVGHVKFLILYLVAGLLGNVFSIINDFIRDRFVVSAGASGAAFGLVGALLWIVIKNRGRIETITTRGVIMMILLSLYYGFSTAGIDNAAHLGGLIGGFIIGMIFYRKREAVVYDVEW